MSTSNDTYPNQTNSTQETNKKERVCIGIDIGTEIPQCNCLCCFHNEERKEKQTNFHDEQRKEKQIKVEDIDD